MQDTDEYKNAYKTIKLSMPNASPSQIHMAILHATNSLQNNLNFSNITINSENVTKSLSMIKDIGIMDNIIKQMINESKPTKQIYNCANCQLNCIGNRCNKCKKLYYCNLDCQKAHWIVHRKECKSVE